MRSFLLHTMSFIFALSNPAAAANEFRSEYGAAVLEALLSMRNSTLKKQSFSTLWLSVRDGFSPSDRAIVDTWVLQNLKHKVPQIEIVQTRDSLGEMGTRLILSQKDATVSLEFAATPEQFVRSGKSILDSRQVLSLGTIAGQLGERMSEKKRLLLAKTSSAFSEEVFKKMSALDFAEYMVNLRFLVDAAQAKQMKNKQASSWLIKLFMNQAYAVVGDACVDAFGFVGTVIDGGKCEVKSKKFSPLFAKTECPDTSASLCNPMVFGLDRVQKGKGLCLTSSDLASGKTCHQLSPLNKESLKADVDAMMKSILAGGEVNGKTQQQLAQQFSQYINTQVSQCEKAAQDSWKMDSQCAELIERKVNFNSYMVDVLSRQMGEKTESRSLASSASKNSDSCNWFCSLSKFIQSPLGIVASTVIGISAMCALKAKLFNICTHNKSSPSTNVSNTSASSTSSTWVPSLLPDHSLPTAPTGEVYSGGVQ